jgi:ParB-like chromosome segregation protein Spo0J
MPKSKKPAWPAEQIEKIPLADLRDNPHNSRTHSAEQIGQIARSMAEWGWTMPILVDEGGTIIAGHARAAAARSLGFKEAPCMRAVGWSEAQKRAYVIADNKLTENGGWDMVILEDELAALSEMGFDADLTGFEVLEERATPPEEFKDVAPFELKHKCPKCGFEFSGEDV